ncbi:hypothetical protein V8687_10250 [Shewanella baltica]|uniref:hypothetical protein n=1 Tax=Shewanella baltica TaxID=62322 RepID=UPI0030D5C612
MKINIFLVIRRHFDSFKEHDSDKYIKLDLIVFFGVPLLMAIIAAKFGFTFSTNAVGSLLNVGALLSGLLLNLLVLVYSLKEKTPKVNVEVDGWKELQLKHRVVNEVYFNVAFSTLTAFAMLILTVVHSCGADFVEMANYLQMLDSVIIFLGINLIFTFLMIIKRISLLFCAEGD